MLGRYCDSRFRLERLSIESDDVREDVVGRVVEGGVAEKRGTAFQPLEGLIDVAVSLNGDDPRRLVHLVGEDSVGNCRVWHEICIPSRRSARTFGRPIVW